MERLIKYLTISQTDQFAATVGNVRDDQIEFFVLCRNHASFVIMFSDLNAEFHIDWIDFGQKTNTGIAS